MLQVARQNILDIGDDHAREPMWNVTSPRDLCGNSIHPFFAGRTAPIAVAVGRRIVLHYNTGAKQQDALDVFLVLLYAQFVEETRAPRG